MEGRIPIVLVALFPAMIFRLLQELGVDALLPALSEFGSGGKTNANRLWAPACPLTQGEFSAADLDGPSSLYK